jgi:cell division protein FtsB
MRPLSSVDYDTARRTKISLILKLIVALMLIVYFGYHLVTGQRGLIAWQDVSQRLDASQDRLSALQEQQQNLEKRAKLLRGDNLDLDMAEEQARRTLGYTEPGEKVILLPQEPPAANIRSKSAE